MSATNRGSIKISQEFYPTPDYTRNSLYALINWDKVNSFLEPCKGNGVLYYAVPDTVEFKDYSEIREGKDYLTDDYNFYDFDLIVTNPPFSLTCEFIEKSFTEVANDGCICYLQRLNFLGSQKRKNWWSKIGTPNKLLVLSKRPKFVNGASDASEYAFFCWDFGNKIKLKNGIHVI
jgi:hypothetical protein